MIKIRNFLGWLLFLFVVLMLANIIYLDYKILRPEGVSLFSKPNVVVESLSANPTPAISGITRNEIEELIKIATASLQPQATQRPSQIVQTTTSGVKEFFVHLGSGNNSSDEWTDLPGVEAYIDSTKYGKIKSVVFEVALNIPTGNQVAYARLFNVTDKHPVWFSEVSLEGGTPKLLTSQPITLDLGSKLYRVQMKTSLKYQTNLTSARVKITVE